jgi:hypothetical protein
MPFRRIDRGVKEAAVRIHELKTSSMCFISHGQPSFVFFGSFVRLEALSVTKVQTWDGLAILLQMISSPARLVSGRAP